MNVIQTNQCSKQNRLLRTKKINLWSSFTMGMHFPNMKA